jgi:putative membrane protein
MVWTERGLKKAWSSLIFLFTGTFGFLTLNSLPSDTALFPALTGLFGFSGLVVSFYGKSKLPKQKRTARPKGTGAKGALTGWVAGMMAGILPGVGSSQVSAITAQTFRSNTREFLTSLGGINAANIIFTLIAFYTLGKTRSGAAWSISQLVPSLTFMEMVIIVVVALATAMLSVVLVLRMARFLIARISSLDYRKINLSIITFLVLAVFFFTGPLGLFISFTGALLGVLTIKVGIKRSQMMGFLIFPTILYFAGLTGLFSILLGL